MPDCYKCVHRRGSRGDVHSSCEHPSISGGPGDKFIEVLTGNAARHLHVTANPHGVEMGWFYWPVNYDPIWLYTCDGFEAKG